MDSTDAADLIAEIHEDRAESHAADRFRNRAALMIAIMAAILAVGGLGGGNATDDMIENNIKASDTWAFYQAKNVRQTMYRIEREKLQSELAGGAFAGPAHAEAEARLKSYAATIARYDSEPDPEAPSDPTRGEGKKELSARAKSYEAAFEQAARRDNAFDFAEVLLQLALVLGSVAILAVNRWILILSGVLGTLGALLTLNGFLLLV
ncbi:MAG TPA: DUF4337 domain-containing protein [Allosphingosinicella sp.]|jgi:hypothetical protein|nr:DUF4337 domain-containing protein [Allosphingosinicella sp.]